MQNNSIGIDELRRQMDRAAKICGGEPPITAIHVGNVEAFVAEIERLNGPLVSHSDEGNSAMFMGVEIRERSILPANSFVLMRNENVVGFGKFSEAARPLPNREDAP